MAASSGRTLSLARFFRFISGDIDKDSGVDGEISISLSLLATVSSVSDSDTVSDSVSDFSSDVSDDDEELFLFYEEDDK